MKLAEYISPLLARARTISIPLFLSATAACFREAFRVVDGILTISGSSRNKGGEREPVAVKVEQAEDVMCVSSQDHYRTTNDRACPHMAYSYKMFEPNMDDYLDDEMDELKRIFDVICKEWERSVSFSISSVVCSHPHACPIHRS